MLSKKYDLGSKIHKFGHLKMCFLLCFLFYKIFINLEPFIIYVRVRNFGRPSMISLNRTSSNKGPLTGPVRHEGFLVGLSGTPGTQAHILLNTNTCSIDVPMNAQVCLGGASGSVNWKLETLKHIVNRRAPGTSNLRNLCAVYPFHLCFGMPHNSLSLKIFSLKIFS